MTGPEKAEHAAARPPRQRRAVAGAEVTAFLYRYAAPLQGVPLLPSDDYVGRVESQP